MNSDLLQPEIENEEEEGVALDELPVGARLEIETRHHTYVLENRGDGKAIISGHPEYCPDPVLVTIYGSTWGGPMLKMRFLGRGMRLEFKHPVLGPVRTSAIRDIRELTPAPNSGGHSSNQWRKAS